MKIRKFRQRTKPTRCPKCCSTQLRFTEEWNGGIIDFYLDENGKIDPVGVVGSPDSVERVVAVCEKCQHYWTLKGVTGISDLPEYPSVGGEYGNQIY